MNAYRKNLCQDELTKINKNVKYVKLRSHFLTFPWYILIIELSLLTISKSRVLP